VTHWLDKVVEILNADTNDLRQLARIAGYNPKNFYRWTSMDGADLRGQDLTGMKFARLDLSKVKVDSNTRVSGRLLGDQSVFVGRTPEDSVLMDLDREKASLGTRAEAKIAVARESADFYRRLLDRTSGSAERKSLMGLDKGVGFCLRGDLEAE